MGSSNPPGREPAQLLGADDPFAAPPEARRPDRRLRGHLVAPVTVVSAGDDAAPAGLTVSSLAVAEGDPPRLLALVDPLSALFEQAKATGRFLVHVLSAGDERVASLFAGGYPADPFEELAWSSDAYGPLLAGERDVARCRFTGSESAGFQDLVRAEVDAIDLASGARRAPLVWYRGSFGSIV